MDVSDAVAEIDGSMPRTRLGSIAVRGGTIFWLGVALLCLAAIALMCFRPARVVGVSEAALAHSLQAAADASGKAACEERGDDGRWTCSVSEEPDPSSGRRPVAIYSVDTSDWGCWDAKLLASGVAGDGGGSSLGRSKGVGDDPRSLDGCITVADLIRIGH